MNEQLVKRVAKHLWRKAGEPEKDYEPTSVGYPHYERMAREVLLGLGEMGLRVSQVKARIPPATTQEP